jgi:hypothetical protein
MFLNRTFPKRRKEATKVSFDFRLLCHEHILGGCPKIAPIVIPVKTGIQKLLISLDARLRGHDDNWQEMNSRTASYGTRVRPI